VPTSSCHLQGYIENKPQVEQDGIYPPGSCSDIHEKPIGVGNKDRKVNNDDGQKAASKIAINANKQIM